jgi:hypothetical protein
MKTTIRVLLSFVSFIASFYFIFRVPFLLIPGARDIAWIPIAISLILASLLAFYVWKKTVSLSNGLASTVLLGGIIVGAICFVLGFIGPMIFNGGAQGPIIGFVTGPIGFILGLVGGAIFWLIKKKKKAVISNN